MQFSPTVGPGPCVIGPANVCWLTSMPWDRCHVIDIRFLAQCLLGQQWRTTDCFSWVDRRLSRRVRHYWHKPVCMLRSNTVPNRGMQIPKISIRCQQRFRVQICRCMISYISAVNTQICYITTWSISQQTAHDQSLNDLRLNYSYEPIGKWTTRIYLS